MRHERETNITCMKYLLTENKMLAFYAIKYFVLVDRFYIIYVKICIYMCTLKKNIIFFLIKEKENRIF